MSAAIRARGDNIVLPFDPIEEWLLHSHPNPDRVDCPGEEVLKKIADRSLPVTHPARKHIRSCSPCYREFAVLRNQRRAADKMRRQKWLGFAIAVAGVLVIGTWLGLVFHRKKEVSLEAAPPPIVSMVLNLRDIETSRGSDPNRLEHVEIPRQLVKLTIDLPRFSASGFYTIGLLRSKESNSAMALTGAPSVPGKGGIDVTAILDLRQIPAGPYFLGTRRDNYSAYYYPVTVKR